MGTHMFSQHKPHDTPTTSPTASVFDRMRSKVQATLDQATTTGGLVTCRACRRALSPTCFYVGRSVLRCKTCTSARRRRKAIRDPLAQVLARTQRESEKAKASCTVTLSWLRDSWRTQNGRCWATGLRLELYLDRHHPLQATLALLDPQQGYTNENAVLVVRCFALFKGPLLLKEALALWAAAAPRVEVLTKIRNDVDHAEMVETFRGTDRPPALLVQRATT